MSALMVLLMFSLCGKDNMVHSDAFSITIILFIACDCITFYLGKKLK